MYESKSNIEDECSNSQILLKFIFTLLLALILTPSLAIGDVFTFSPPFILKQKTGSPLSIVSLSIDEDLNGDTLYIYTTINGTESFITKDRIMNFDALYARMYPAKVKTGSNLSPQAPSANAPSSSDDYTYTPPSSSAIDPEDAARLINSMYGRVCHAKIEGIFTKTLIIDWTSSTKIIHSMKVLAEIGSIKEQLYRGGVRYFQFPNDAGTYNVIDWKTGHKKSISDRADYYFRK